MKVKLALLLTCTSVLLTGCNMVKGSGTKATETRKVAPFTGVVIKGAADVTIQVGPEQSVTVETDDNLISMVTTEVENGRLVIGMEGSYVTTLGIEVKITVPKLDSIKVDGSGDVKASGALGAELEMAVEGSGDVEIDGIDAEQVAVSIEGSGDVKAAGQVSSLDVRIDGSGDADLSKLIAAEVKVNSEGSGDTRVHATQTLHVDSNGSGDVSYQGDPEVTKNVDGSGDVTRE